ncbi:MAG: ATP-binding cassette domain-containing protein [Candidatus Dactylopiibacterium sp.]|nr:ATP-binding cassette domain-containing protein [Candidatus Dactylopiibacterium sp.]
MIEISGLTKTYGTTRVVDNVSLRIPRGGVTSIIGPNGAGKSTLLAMSARLLEPDAGEVTLDGLAVRESGGETLARRLAILRQDNHMTMRLTVRDLVSFGRYPHSRGRLGAEDQRKIGEALAYLDLCGLETRFLDQLSGGQRQRAYIAMVLAQDTDYVLLDEPLNNLDLRHASLMMRLLRRLADELGKTVVVVMHDINFAAAWSDRIVAMKDGRVVADGVPDTLMQPATLAAIYDMDMPVEALHGRRAGLYWLAPRVPGGN